MTRFHRSAGISDELRKLCANMKEGTCDDNHSRYPKGNDSVYVCEFLLADQKTSQSRVVGQTKRPSPPQPLKQVKNTVPPVRQ